MQSCATDLQATRLSSFVRPLCCRLMISREEVAFSTPLHPSFPALSSAAPLLIYHICGLSRLLNVRLTSVVHVYGCMPVHEMYMVRSLNAQWSSAISWKEAYSFSFSLLFSGSIVRKGVGGRLYSLRLQREYKKLCRRWGVCLCAHVHTKTGERAKHHDHKLLLEFLLLSHESHSRATGIFISDIIPPESSKEELLLHTSLNSTCFAT